MKKLTAFLLSVGLLFTLVACSSNKVDDKALETLESAINNVPKMKTASYQASIDTQTEGGEKVNLTLRGGYLADTANPSFTGVVNMSSGEQTMDGFMELYMQNRVMYINIPLMGMKQKSSSNMLEDAGILPEVDEDTFTMDKEAIKPYLKTAKQTGSTLTFELDTDKFNKLVKGQSDLTSQVMGTSGETTYNKVTLEMDVQDGFATKIMLELDGQQKTDTETKKITGTITLAFSDINANKALTFPDFSGYTEAS